MLFTWLKQRRRHKLLATPFPQEWLSYLRDNVALYATLTEVEQTKLRDLLRDLTVASEGTLPPMKNDCILRSRGSYMSMARAGLPSRPALPASPPG